MDHGARIGQETGADTVLAREAPPRTLARAEVAIVGAGLAGSLLALVLARAGTDVAIVDPRRSYPDDFRCEKFTADQVALLEELGVLDAVKAATGDPATQGFRYDTVVNAIRAAWPRSVRFVEGRVAEVSAGVDEQWLTLADGAMVRARLLVLATGAGERLRASLGVRRQMLPERRSVCIGFSLRPTNRDAFPFDGVVHAGERAGDGLAFASLFPLDGLMRVNLFSYRDPAGAWTRGFRELPLTRLFEVMPRLERKLGPVEVVGPVEVRPTELYRSEGVVQPGVVLIGDAFQVSCPATGRGVTRILTDVRQLARRHIPAWLATPGMSADKIAAFYDDPVKRTADALAEAQGERRRSMATQTSAYWRARRLASRLRRTAGPRPEGRTARRGADAPKRFRSGEWVEVRSAAEILPTLDADGRLEGLPFMPEMARLCGTRLRVFRPAEKTCVEGFGLRRMKRAVLLEDVRCDGASHDGCERGCLMFWKTAWLKPSGETGPVLDAASEADAMARLLALPIREDDRYVCQSTKLAEATGPLPRWDYAHLFVDMSRGDLSLRRLLAILWRSAVNRVRGPLKLGELGQLYGRTRRPPKGDLGLACGDRVRVKEAGAIRTVLDGTGRNNGLTFEPEMSLYIGGEYQVEAPVTRIIHEETGRMVELSRTVALKGLHCQGLCVKNCPRRNPLYWREAWLERVEPPPS